MYQENESGMPLSGKGPGLRASGKRSGQHLPAKEKARGARRLGPGITGISVALLACLAVMAAKPGASASAAEGVPPAAVVDGAVSGAVHAIHAMHTGCCG